MKNDLFELNSKMIFIYDDDRSMGLLKYPKLDIFDISIKPIMSVKLQIEVRFRARLVNYSMFLVLLF